MAIKTFIKTLQDWMPPIHKEGHIFIVIFSVITFGLFQIWDGFGYFGIVATIWCAAFFRDPERFTPEGDNLIVSPADGIVSKIETAKFPSELGLNPDVEVTRVTIFLNIFNVHIQRFPIAGDVKAVNYHPGKFLSADLDKASDENERNSIVINTKHKNKTIVCVQIAGLIARRIVCFVKSGEALEGGERYGLIRFGSRVDIYLPKGVQPKVLQGQVMIGAETIIADLDDEPKEFVDGVSDNNSIVESDDNAQAEIIDQDTEFDEEKREVPVDSSVTDKDKPDEKEEEAHENKKTFTLTEDEEEPSIANKEKSEKLESRIGSLSFAKNNDNANKEEEPDKPLIEPPLSESESESDEKNEELELSEEVKTTEDNVKK